jgi:hypothetical protein
MLPYEFAELRTRADEQAACHAIFDEAHTSWSYTGRGSINSSQLTVMCVETFFGEVLNGGIEQYLTNESGRNASFGPDALRRVGLSAYAAILDEALKSCINTPEENDFGDVEDFYEPPPACDDDADDPFGDFDHRIYELYNANPAKFREKLFQFIMENEDDFVSKG